MEPLENNEQLKGPGRPKNVTDDVMAARAREVRSHLMLNHSRNEICKLMNISRGEYRSALAWVGRQWTNNNEVYGDFILGERNRLEAIQMQINSIMSEACFAPITEG